MRTRGGRVCDRSGVPNLFMVRMLWKQLTNIRMYISKFGCNRNVAGS